MATVWQSWSGSSTATTTSATWTDWICNDTTSGGATNVWYRWTSDTDTAALALLLAEERRQWNAQYCSDELSKAEEKRRLEARERAKKLLEETMTEEERKTYAERKVIPITSKSGRLYHVKRGVVGNVFRFENGKEVERYCIHPVENVP